MKNIVELRNITFSYSKKSKPILENISLEIPQGQMVAVIGPSGVGKTSLFRLLVKNIKPNAGSLNLFESDISNISKKQWKKIINKIGFLTQKPNLINTDNVYNNVKRSFTQYKNWFYRLISYIDKEQRMTIFKTLDDLDILEKAFYRISDLSGGQQQRVEITKLLVKNVDLILADEPTSNLDNETSKDVLKILQKLVKEKNMTVIVNIHDLSLVNYYFDRVIALNDKQIVMDKPTKNVELWEMINIVKKIK
ncbi:phosphonate ABC transporter ATP-binding protein [Mycoplasma sp. Mirounga ES2805-ORL]|uniref:phosphonate ABC transporter ATP-binding protein n=1 Tax=Mycoplasma sp. Mirounga ES2805-ORL TaxID=754514 RepID=UPI00197C16F3|nr:ATP-binding cassette domain-containing protein [Mycoplasma sp. Mirounga ES2805-ORL]QSF13638.1 ATP-binding cassette domain-containing protein [Mycoplasma sp. Mirounga ES2805-ORL]